MQEDGPSTRETLHDWLTGRGEQLKKLYALRDEGKAPLVYVPIGLPSLEAKGMLEPGVLTLAVAHPGDGKSAFALQAAEGAARAGMDVQAYFIEDPRKMVADRTIAPILGESAFKLRRLTLEDKAPEMAARIDAAVAGASWTKRVIVDDQYHETPELLQLIDERWTKRTKLLIIDYLQAFDSEPDEPSVERVLARLIWKLNVLAKERNAAALLLCQPKTREVEDRGRRWFESCRWKARAGKDGSDPEPTLEWVEGFRPTVGDIQWATGAAKQRCRAAVSIFRPGSWMRMMGVNWKDDRSETQICKNNYGVNNEKVVFGWDGATGRLIDKGGKK